ncbi:MAG: transcriptional regulator with XRE-family HTH domain [Phenylobacterium sp.]|jgi:transcriptional regulator with XRE-family HTH domain
MKDEAKITNQKLASQLKEIRYEQSITMRSLADALGMPHSFVGKTEHQGRRLDIGEFIHYCKALAKDPAQVLKTIIDD